jgi:hypothetical protein
MFKATNTQLPPPENWQDFETLCWDIWKRVWRDPNTQKNGRTGQPQNGVDIFGRPGEGSSHSGIQCKGKDNFIEKSLTESELIGEVEKAKSFTPRIQGYGVAIFPRKSLRKALRSWK